MWGLRGCDIEASVDCVNGSGRARRDGWVQGRVTSSKRLMLNLERVVEDNDDRIYTSWNLN